MAVRRTVFGRADPGVDQVALPQHICYRAELVSAPATVLRAFEMSNSQSARIVFSSTSGDFSGTMCEFPGGRRSLSGGTYTPGHMKAEGL